MIKKVAHLVPHEETETHDLSVTCICVPHIVVEAERIVIIHELMDDLPKFEDELPKRKE